MLFYYVLWVIVNCLEISELEGGLKKIDTIWLFYCFIVFCIFFNKTKPNPSYVSSGGVFSSNMSEKLLDK